MIKRLGPPSRCGVCVDLYLTASTALRFHFSELLLSVPWARAANCADRVAATILRDLADGAEARRSPLRDSDRRPRLPRSRRADLGQHLRDAICQTAARLA